MSQNPATYESQHQGVRSNQPGSKFKQNYNLPPSGVGTTAAEEAAAARRINEMHANSASTKLNRQATANHTSGSVAPKDNKLIAFVGEQPLGMADN